MHDLRGPRIISCGSAQIPGGTVYLRRRLATVILHDPASRRHVVRMGRRCRLAPSAPRRRRNRIGHNEPPAHPQQVVSSDGAISGETGCGLSASVLARADGFGEEIFSAGLHLVNERTAGTPGNILEPGGPAGRRRSCIRSRILLIASDEAARSGKQCNQPDVAQEGALHAARLPIKRGQFQRRRTMATRARLISKSPPKR